MSHENEEQDERDSEDTNSSRIRVIGMAVIGYAIVACAAWFFLFELGSIGDQMLDPAAAITDNQAAANVTSTFPPAAYLAPLGDSLLTAEQRGYANMRVAHDTAALATILGNNPEITLIYLHPAAVENVDSAFLRQQYRNGKLIAALNTPLSQLTAVLDITPTQADLPFEEFATAVISVSAVKTQTSGTPLEFTNAYGQFEQVPLVLDGLQ